LKTLDNVNRGPIIVRPFTNEGECNGTEAANRQVRSQHSIDAGVG